MFNITVLIISIVLVIGLGGGVAFLIFFKFKPKRKSWYADCYRVGDGEVPPPKDKDGNFIHPLSLKELRPYSKDVIEKQELKKGVINYKLKKLQLMTPEVKPEHEEFWGEEKSQVSVLMDGESCRLMTKGYDVKSGTIIFVPTPADQLNLIKGEIIDRQSRLADEATTMQAITPWIVTGICMVALIVIVYLQGKAYIETAEINQVTMGEATRAGVEISKINQDTIYQTQNIKPTKGLEEPAQMETEPPPPEIE